MAQAPDTHGRVARLAGVMAVAVATLTTAGAAQAATVQTFQVPTANSGLSDITTGPDGNLYFTEDQDAVVGGQETFHVGELTTGGLVSEVPVPFEDADSSGVHEGPTSITSSGGRMWFLSSVGNSVYTLGPGASSVTYTTDLGFSDNGEDLAPAPGGGVWSTTEPESDIALIDATGNPSFLSVNSDGPGTVAESPSGGAYYANGSESINAIDAAGNAASYPLPSDPTGGGDTYAMAFDRSGNLWYSTYHFSFETGGFNGEIGVLRPGAATGQTVVAMDPASGKGPYATDLVLGPDGAIWFAWTSTPDGVTSKPPSGVGRVDPATGQVQYFNTVQSNSVLPTRIAFGGDGNLYFIDRVDNLVGRVVDPTSVFASTPSPAPTPTPGPTKTKTKTKARAPKVVLNVPHQTLTAVSRHRRLAVDCRLRGAGTCAVTADIAARTARHLHLKVAKKAKHVALAHASRTLKHKGTAKLTLKLSKKSARGLARDESLKLTLHVTSSRKGTTARHATQTLKLKR